MATAVYVCSLATHQPAVGQEQCQGPMEGPMGMAGSSKAGVGGSGWEAEWQLFLLFLSIFY